MLGGGRWRTLRDTVVGIPDRVLVWQGIGIQKTFVKKHAYPRKHSGPWSP